MKSYFLYHLKRSKKKKGWNTLKTHSAVDGRKRIILVHEGPHHKASDEAHYAGKASITQSQVGGKSTYSHGRADGEEEERLDSSFLMVCMVSLYLSFFRNRLGFKDSHYLALEALARPKKEGQADRPTGGEEEWSCSTATWGSGEWNDGIKKEKERKPKYQP